MRRSLFAVGPWLAVSCCLISAHSLAAATIEGRVVDSAGQPVAGAEVRIWERFLGANLASSIRQAEFDGGEVLSTDADGRFVTPEMADSGSFSTMIVAEAEGLLAGRSGWLRIPKDVAAAKAPDITLKRLRLVTGRVADRRGQPVDGATVFNTGDGHERVETTSKGGGKFRLANVPDGGVFLFAEKPGYRFTGVRLPAGQAEAALTLTSLDEPAEPLATLPPLLSADEEYALARAVLDPWLERLAKSGNQRQRKIGYACLAGIDGLEAFNRLDTLFESDPQSRESFRSSAIRSIIEHHVRVPPDELRTLIDSGENDYYKASLLIQAADEMDAGEQATRLEWVASALPHARKVADPTQRVCLLASAAERLFELEEVADARQILAEAENEAKSPIPDAAAGLAFLHLALAAAHDDADRALNWLAKTDKSSLWRHGGRVAAGLLPDHPQRAVEAWKLVAESKPDDQGRSGLEYRTAVDFCYRLAKVDRGLAEQVAADADEMVLRYRDQGAIILALAETRPTEARRLLAALVREQLWQLPREDFRFLPLQSAPAIAAWLLPVAERVDPDLCGELFWRSLALRLPRPRRNSLYDQVKRTDIHLAMLLARYDRDIARSLLEDPVHAPAAGWLTSSGWLASYRFAAALQIDLRWAKSLLDALDDSPSSNQLDFSLRSNLLYAMSLPLPERWSAPNDLGFWTPAARDKPLQP